VNHWGNGPTIDPDLNEETEPLINTVPELFETHELTNTNEGDDDE
jgi:hypothetical protein